MAKMAKQSRPEPTEAEVDINFISENGTYFSGLGRLIKNTTAEAFYGYVIDLEPVGCGGFLIYVPSTGARRLNLPTTDTGCSTSAKEEVK